MTSLQEIEAAIRTLPPSDQDDLFSWIEQQYSQAFDMRLQRDVQSGAMDKLIGQALAEAEAGHVREL